MKCVRHLVKEGAYCVIDRESIFHLLNVVFVQNCYFQFIQPF